jgi:ADP-heptose:LPS heptosyltransferase
MGEMDLVISVDTSAIHLAGALGRPAWLLLPHRYEWRWGLEGEANAWYNSVRVFRQGRPGAWSELLAKVDAELQLLSKSRTGT